MKKIVTEKQLLDNLTNGQFYCDYTIPEILIERYKDKVYWQHISIWQPLTESFIEKHKNLVDWDHISRNQILTINFVIKHKDLVNRKNIIQNQNSIIS